MGGVQPEDDRHKNRAAEFVNILQILARRCRRDALQLRCVPDFRGPVTPAVWLHGCSICQQSRGAEEL